MKFVITGFFILIYLQSNSQSPGKWKFFARKVSSGVYEIHLSAAVNDPWHIYSQHTPPGGPLATKVSLVRNPLIFLEGETMEIGEIHEFHDKTFDIDVLYYTTQVDFVQIVKLKANVKATLYGNVKFMFCNDHACMPPQSLNFNIDLK